MRPAGLELDLFVGPAGDLEVVRAAARRCCDRGYGPARIHRHAFAADCAGEDHELVDVDGPLRLEVARLEPEAGRG